MDERGEGQQDDPLKAALAEYLAIPGMQARSTGLRPGTGDQPCRARGRRHRKHSGTRNRYGLDRTALRPPGAGRVSGYDEDRVRQADSRSGSLRARCDARPGCRGWCAGRYVWRSAPRCAPVEGYRRSSERRPALAKGYAEEACREHVGSRQADRSHGRRQGQDDGGPRGGLACFGTRTADCDSAVHQGELGLRRGQGARRSPKRRTHAHRLRIHLVGRRIQANQGRWPRRPGGSPGSWRCPTATTC